jgi:hypothetical protein
MKNEKLKMENEATGPTRSGSFFMLQASSFFSNK